MQVEICLLSYHQVFPIASKILEIINFVVGPFSITSETFGGI